MAAFTTAMLVGSLAFSGVRAVQSIRAGGAAAEAGEQDREAAESVARLHEFNAGVADLQAEDALERGAFAEARFREQIRGIIGSQRAGLAASNVDVGFGSSLDVQADAAYLGELDVIQLRNNAAREAWGYEIEAADLRQRAEISRKEGVALEAAGRERRTQSYLDAGASLISGGTTYIQQRYGFG